MTRREFNVSVGTAAVGAAVLPLTGCSNSGLVAALDVTEVACSVAAPLVPVFAAQLGPAGVAQVNEYLSGVSNACAESVTELGNTSDSQAVQYTKMAGYFDTVITVSLPPGIGTEITAVIGAVITGVQLILKIIKNTPAPAPTPAVSAKLKTYQDQVKALGSDKARMADVLQRHEQLKKLIRK